MAAAGVPTAAHTVVTDPEAGLEAITGYPTVIKADGLAAGKGVIIAEDEEQARDGAERPAGGAALRHRAGGGGGVPGRARSCRCWRSATVRTALPLASAQDYKRIFDGDRGPNTGGMGSYSPVPAIDERERARSARARASAGARRAGAGAGSPSTASSTPG